MQITLNHLDKFAWIGVFSAPMRNFDSKTAFNGIFSDPTAFNRKVHLFWIGAGTAETASMTALRQCMRLWIRRASRMSSMNRRARRTSSRRGGGIWQISLRGFFGEKE